MKDPTTRRSRYVRHLCDPSYFNEEVCFKGYVVNKEPLLIGMGVGTYKSH